MGAGELVGRGPHVHAGVVENEVVKVDELALQPQTGTGVIEVSPRNPAVADRAFGQPFVEPGQRILGRRQCRFPLPISIVDRHVLAEV